MQSLSKNQLLIGSVQIENGCIVELFSECNFQGNSVILASSASSLPLKNEVSSVVVQLIPGNGAMPVLFYEKYLSGPHQILPMGPLNFCSPTESIRFPQTVFVPEGFIVIFQSECSDSSNSVFYTSSTSQFFTPYNFPRIARVTVIKITEEEQQDEELTEKQEDFSEPNILQNPEINVHSLSRQKEHASAIEASSYVKQDKFSCGGYACPGHPSNMFAAGCVVPETIAITLCDLDEKCKCLGIAAYSPEWMERNPPGYWQLGTSFVANDYWVAFTK